MPPALAAGTDGSQTTWITHPDGYRIELVQWPNGRFSGAKRGAIGGRHRTTHGDTPRRFVQLDTS